MNEQLHDVRNNSVVLMESNLIGGQILLVITYA